MNTWYEIILNGWYAHNAIPGTKARLRAYKQDEVPRDVRKKKYASEAEAIKALHDAGITRIVTHSLGGEQPGPNGPDWEVCECGY